jgi:hypothetical protein
MELQKFQSHLPADDGWNAAAAEEAERLLRGVLIKFIDWKYYAGKQRTPLPEGFQLIALATVACWQDWQGGKVVKSIVREPGKYLPAREALGDLDETQWEVKNGKPVDPWATTRLIYLVHPVSAALYTFSTSSGGGRSARGRDAHAARHEIEAEIRDRRLEVFGHRRGIGADGEATAYGCG